MKRQKFLTLLVVFVAFCSCTKLEVDCQYTIVPKAINAEGETVSLSGDIVAYSFRADTAVWGVKSYVDASAGIVTQRVGSQTMNYEAKEFPNQEGCFVFNFTSKPQMLVVCSTATNVYAYRGANIEENLGKMTVPITFDTRLSDTTYFSSGWHYVYGNE